MSTAFRVTFYIELMLLPKKGRCAGTGSEKQVEVGGKDNPLAISAVKAAEDTKIRQS